VIGESLPPAARLAVLGHAASLPTSEAIWSLHGVTSNERYVLNEEKTILSAKQEGLGRPESSRAALIPIRKHAEWWALAQDARRQVFEEQSHHVALGLHVLPAVARRLHHCRDIGTQEPFDFLTWFEYAQSDAALFEELVKTMRATPEWHYVEREVDIRLVRDDR